MRRRQVMASVTALILVLAVAACGDDENDNTAQSGSTERASSGEPLKIGVLTSLTGAAGAGFTGVDEGVNARLAAYREEEGACDRKFEVVMADDTSSPQGALAATKKLVEQDGVFAVLPVSSFFYGAGDYAGTQAAETPMLGASFDGGKQWLNEDYGNLFAALGSVDFTRASSTFGEYWKEIGGTKAAVVGFTTPSSAGASLGVMASAEKAGLERAYVNVKLPFGTSDVGPVVLAIKNSGADVLYAPVTADTAFAIAGGLRQAGVKMKSVLLATGYGSDLLKSEPATQAAQGLNFLTSFAPVELEANKGAQKLVEALKKHAGSASGIPSFSEGMGWITTSALLHGLEKAGCDATQEDFISAMRDSSDFDAEGLFGQPIDYSERGDIAGGNGPGNCIYVSKLEGKTFIPDPAASPRCGELLEGTVSP